MPGCSSLGGAWVDAQTQYMLTRKNPGTAVLIEVVGILFSFPGLGSVYGGNMLGLLLTFTYLPLQVLNFFLVFLFIGMVTMPLTFVAYLVIGIVMANSSVATHNQRLALTLGAVPL